MNILILSVPLFLIYAALLYWLMTYFNFKKIWQEPLNKAKASQPMTLTMLTKRLLDFLLVLFLVICVVIPVVVMVMAISQSNSPTWGIDIGVFSGFMIDLNHISNLEATGIRNPEFSGKTLINIDTSNLFAWYLYNIISELSAIIVVFVIVQLRAIVISLHNGRALIEKNSHRVKKIGLIVIIWNLFTPLLQYFGWGYVIEKISINSEGFILYPDFEINVMGLLVGTMLILLSKILQEAAAVKQDQELTI